MPNKNSVETSVPMTTPMLRKDSTRCCSRSAVTAMAADPNDDDGRVPEREEESDRYRTLSFLHQFAGYVVDGRNVVGIDGMPQAEAVGEECCTEQ